MKLPVLNASGKELRKVDVDDSVFGIKPNGSVLHQAYVTQRNNQRWGTAQTRTRGEVVGSTAKIHRQKGTGRARAGTARSPTRVGGGTAFGPRMRDYSQALPKKMRRLAIRSALSGKAADGQLVVIDELTFNAPKTKQMIETLQNVGIERSVLIVTSESDRTLLASARNLKKTKVLPARYLNVGDMLNHQGLLMTVDAVRIAEELWAVKGAPVKVKEEKKPARRTRAKAKAEPEAEAEAPAAEAATEAEAPAEEKKPARPAGGPARRTRAAATPKDEAKAEKKPRARRAPKAEASAEEKPKRATRSRAKAADGEDKPAAADKPKTTRRRTTKKTEDTPESEG